MVKLSLVAADELVKAIERGMTMFCDDADEMMGETDCPEGCHVDPDGICNHGWAAAELTLLRTVA